MSVFSNIFKRKGTVYNSTTVLGIEEAKWSDQNYTTYAKESYMLNAVAFRCIDICAKSFSQVNWNIYENKGDEIKEAEKHPLKPLLKRANPATGFSFFQYANLSYLLMCGNNYIQKIAPDMGANKGIPKELWTLRPDKMSVKVNSNTQMNSKYVYDVNNNPVVFEVDQITMQSDILHMKLFNPLDNVYGMALTQPAARDIDSLNSSKEWNKRLLDNQARPGMMLFYEKYLDDIQYKRLKKDLEDAREGAQNAGKSLILDGAKDAKPYGFSPTELDWIKSNLELARSICGVYGVPAQIIGIPDVSTYSNYQEARTAFWEDTVLFYLSLYKDEFNNWLFKDQQYYIDYDLDSVPALQYKQDMKWKRANESTFLSINERRETVGYEAIDGGEDVLIPATMIPLGSEPDNEQVIDDTNDKTKKALSDIGVDDTDLTIGLS